MSYDTNDLELVTYRKVYPTFFQLTPSVNDYNDVRVDIVARYGWTDIGLLYSSNDNFYVQVWVLNCRSPDGVIYESTYGFLMTSGRIG